ncbi:hypothetical protein FHS15_000618 [Paenibacillus castaneae]|uniref:hypothetical protein n=1 Tax=Paenibacillus castaneae TaxID=474957 RepID=UPI000C99CA7E|nr:hypothetical protein [Paenibacillus castaneae]NIK75518.1 hypothetical protein [Paenibacillus castaneae]
MSKVTDKISFAEFMFNPAFKEFNNIEHEKHPKMNPIIEAWDNKTLTDNISKLNRELLRRDAHGLNESPFSESNQELHLQLYSLIMYLKQRLAKEPS